MSTKDNREPNMRSAIGLCSDCHFLLQPADFGPLLQLPLLSSSFLLYHSLAFLDFTILPFGRLFTCWMVCNLLECLFLHCLHPHSSPSSSMLSLAILRLYISSVRSTVKYICLCSFLGSSGKSACQVSPFTYLPHCTDPFLPPQIAPSVSPSSIDV